MSKSGSLLKYQLKVLSTFFKSKWSFPKLKEFILYTIYYSTNWFYFLFISTLEYLKIKNQNLKKIDRELTKIYDNENQFWIALKESYKIKNEKVSNLTYGETPFFTIKKSLEIVNLNENDIFYDLGCGIGKTVFVANSVFKAKSIGVDIIPDFITNANILVKKLNLKDISFIKKNIFHQSLKDGTVFYITPTCFDRETMSKVLEKFKSLPKGARLIVLTKHLDLPNLKLTAQKKLFYSWGPAYTFYYEVV